MKQEHDAPAQEFEAAPAERTFSRAMLRLVKGGRERAALQAGQVDAILDPDSGSAILLPDAQRALLARQSAHADLADLAIDWTWEQDSQGRFVYQTGLIDDGFMFGGLDIIGKALWELPLDNLGDSGWSAHAQRVAWQFAFRDLEVQWLDRQGGIRFAAISGEPTYDERQGFTGYRGIARDVTEQRLAPYVAAERWRLQGAAFDALPTPLCILDANGDVLEANKAWMVLTCAPDRIVPTAHVGANYLAACDSAEGCALHHGLAVGTGTRQVLSGALAEFCFDLHADEGASDPTAKLRTLLRVTHWSDGETPLAIVSVA